MVNEKSGNKMKGIKERKRNKGKKSKKKRKKEFENTDEISK